MATQQSASVSITNDSGGDAQIYLFHSSTPGTQSGQWSAAPGETVGPLKVLFETGWDTAFTPDWWSVLLHVKNGPAAGFYASTGGSLSYGSVPYWKECQLQQPDADQQLTFSVSTTQFDIALRSSSCTTGMTRVAPYAPITNVFVVMLENHSFDHMFAMSGIPGITAATTADSNTYGGKTYPVQASAPLSMTTDPGHEFTDVVEQLAGQGATYPPGGPYPPMNNSGFVSNYATTRSEGPTPQPQDFGDVMACFDTPTQLPVLYQLATQFAVCDRWHSSLPGPTWPNRFFVHGASSAGLDDSPTRSEYVTWFTPGQGFVYPNGSLYDKLRGAGIPYRFYNDSTGLPMEQSLYSDHPELGSHVGAVPQVSSLAGVSLAEIYSLRQFAADLQGPYPYPYTFIEPHYGDLLGNNYQGGSSQHPMDDVYGGEHLLAAVYEAIRKSPYWETSLLIVTYDEHGGLYDSVAPGSAPAPGDNPTTGYNTHGFDFTTYGLRVPAVVVSPLIPAGTVDHTLYDHASVPKTVEALYGLPPLTERDKAANSVLGLLTLTTPRTDCPASLPTAAPLPKAAAPQATVAARAQSDMEPLPQSGNLVGALQTLRKAEVDLSTGSPPEIAAIEARFQAIQTRGQARDYAASVMQKVGLARAQQQAAPPAP